MDLNYMLFLKPCNEPGPSVCVSVPHMGVCPPKVSGHVADIRCPLVKGPWFSRQSLFVIAFPWAASEPDSLTTSLCCKSYAVWLMNLARLASVIIYGVA